MQKTNCEGNVIVGLNYMLYIGTLWIDKDFKTVVLRESSFSVLII